MAKYINPPTDRFLELKDTVEGELKRTGFDPVVNPPGPEPVLPARLAPMKTEDVLGLCDDFQMFYNYLTDEITRCLTFEEVAKARVTFTKATALKAALANKKLTNDKARTAEVDTDDQYLESQVEHLYFKQMHEAQEERRRKISKSMDRLYRELNLRGQDTPRSAPGTQYGRAPMPPRGFDDGFKPTVTRTLHLPSGAEPPPPVDQ
ncbi:MAG: hypothetical protein HN396_18215 [Gemmatimonadales bacterium]|jgi:hypothetical protein|nr:hypothetical protein [Gemmatimonadales bacterium]